MIKRGKIISVANAKNYQIDFALKNGSSNILVNKIKLIIGLKILALPVMLNELLPKSNICKKKESVFFSNL